MEYPDSLRPDHYTASKPEYMGLSEFEAENLHNLRRAAGNVSLAPTITEIRAYEQLIGTRNFEFITLIPDIFPRPKLTVESSVVPAGEFKHDAKIILHDIDFEFTSRGTMSQEVAENLSAIRAGVVWLDARFKDAMEGEMDTHYGSTRHYWQSDVKRVLLPHIIAGARPVDDHFSEVMLLPLSTSNRYGQAQTLGEKSVEKVFGANVFNERWRSLNGTFSLYKKNNATIAAISTKQLNDLEALQNVMLGEGLSHDELSAIRQDGGLVISPETVPVFQVRNRSKKLLRFRKGPNLPSDLETEDFDACITGEITDTISPEAFKDFSIMRWLHRSAIIFDVEDDFKEVAEQHLAKLPESPVDIYLRENGVKTTLEIEE